MRQTKDPRTLLANSKVHDIKSLAGGCYHYIGAEKCLVHQLTVHSDYALLDALPMQINIDGLPLFNSRTMQLWPILGMLDVRDHDRQKQPFVIGIYAGLHKPNNVDEYLHEFINEIAALERTGLMFKDKNYRVFISNVVCDAQARVFIKNTKSFSGYSGCDKCTERGVYYKSKIIFPLLNASLRSDASFAEMQDIDHHRGPSPFSQLSIGMVSQFPMEYMHCVCLGVVKRLIGLWVTGPLHVRIGGNASQIISNALLRFRMFIPNEFVRKPRSLVDYPRWKATEFRQFLLYTGVVALHGIIDEQLFKNFLLLSVGIRILLCPDLTEAMCSFADALLVAFVEHFSQIYGSDQVVYNVHTLVHLANDARQYGSLENFSAFLFENFLLKLKRVIRKPSKIVQQVTSRLEEQARVEKQNAMFSGSKLSEAFVSKPLFSGPLPSGVPINVAQYGHVRLKNFALTNKQPNNCIKVGEETIGLVINIFKDLSGVHVVFRKFHSKETYFYYPCNSNDLDIFVVSDMGQTLHICNILAVKKKFVLLPFKKANFFVAIPLVHTTLK